MNLAILILIALAAVAVLAGVALVVMGGGGRLARFEADHPPLELPVDRPVTGADVGRVRLPLALWGYHVRGVDEVLRRVAVALGERDTRIAELEERVAELSAKPAGPRVLYPRSEEPAPPRDGDADDESASLPVSAGRHEAPRDSGAGDEA
ncbi:hypothetical protein ACQEU5_12415 [Marinactinospora thermotolerans]|uniref:hypothetical protein n=1 Tax=Marinactinospora thermotolerans TaxID=531310 RepID=UPI001F275938|nr:hypothetical protein [Marinactinospora thermotolerans]